MKLGLVLSNFFMFPNLLIIMIVGNLEGDLHSNSIQNAYTIRVKELIGNWFTKAKYQPLSCLQDVSLLTNVYPPEIL